MRLRYTVSCDTLAAVLRYPNEGYDTLVAACVAALGETCEAARRELDAFADEIRSLSQAEVEELFTQTFDLNPACCLDVGWHLYGEAYERGRFLVKLRGLLRDHGIVENGELPDHLSHVLLLMGRLMPDAGADLVREAVAPALEKMGAVLAQTDNPYRHVLAAARFLASQAVAGRVAEVCHD